MMIIHDPFTAQVIFRHVEEADLPALEWEGTFSHFRRLYQDVFQASQRQEALLWMAEAPGIGLIGQLFVQLLSAQRELADGSTRAYIFGFRIRPGYRGRGVGSKLLVQVEDDLVQRGYESVILNVNQDNQLAQKFYTRHGYQVVGFEPGKWSYIDQFGQRQMVNEPAWRMEKRLTNSEKV
ncbi:MAG: N-acetyltransferase [Anaerolineales bacterium]|nr:N-acetyltransferase [Anaerolineales bacterium]